MKRTERQMKGGLLAAMGAIAAVTCLTGAANELTGASGLRDMVLTTWARDRWFLVPGATIDAEAVGRTAAGEPLTRITLAGTGDWQGLQTQVNLPPTATELSVAMRKTELGPARHDFVFQDKHGWNAVVNTMWALNCDVNYKAAVPKQGWTWMVGFFKSKVEQPYRFCGFRLNGGDPKKVPAGKAITMEAGPIHLKYTPDDKEWLYADLQPKTICMKDGVVAPLTLRVANLGTADRTFKLSLTCVERNMQPMPGQPQALGEVTLKAGELKELPATIVLPLLGRYVIEYRAEAGANAATAKEAVNVVNALDVSEGFRHWSAQRKWFSQPDRKPGSKMVDVKEKDGTVKPQNKADIKVAMADNGISPVRVFPVQSRSPRTSVPLAEALNAPPAADSPIVVVATQLSPAWLFKSSDKQLVFFGDTRRAGLGAPSHFAFATAEGTKVLPNGFAADEAQLKAMSESWVLVWWQNSAGWMNWDIPYLVMLQHRPTALKLDGSGLTATFGGPAEFFATMPLYGYAKLPQKAAFEKDKDAVRFPQDWPAEQLRPWTWTKELPKAVAERCNWWSRALVSFPYDVKETFEVNHATGSVDVKDVFEYVAIANDWKTPPNVCAPFSPTLALAMQSTYPMTVKGKLTDCQHATQLGPYMVVEGAKELSYSMNIGPYLFQAADANLTAPADDRTPARRAQAQLLSGAHADSVNDEGHQWDWRDDNFVWYAQGSTNRNPALTTAHARGDLRQHRKGWQQSRTLYTLLDTTRYGLDERAGLSRRYIDGPGIGNWGSHDWGDSGKLGTDMVYDAYCYAYTTGDWQIIADRWDLITSLNCLPSTMAWCSIGRAAIAEMGDEAPPMLALARMAYAVGDRETYAAAAYWYARELVLHCVKDGGFTKYRAQFQPWHPTGIPELEAATNLWGTNATWQPGGFHCPGGGENQWDNFYVRLDDVDTLRFHQKHATELPQRVMEAAAKFPDEEMKYCDYFARIAVLGEDAAKAQDEYRRREEAAIKAGRKDAKKRTGPPENYALRVTAAWKEFPPKIETLIDEKTPAVADTGWAWDQMNNMGYGLVSQSQMSKGKPPTPQWFWWKSPRTVQGVEWGEKWTFGAVAPGANMVA
ncbi:MAG: hypothetical protein NTW87_02720, partial [Planctomycetota bacterium]|nr:hypothetical protein [Planctomycetota bacterium]